MLRIIAGERRGTRLQTLEGLETRPLRGRVRESLFNILQGYPAPLHVLDLFAGSGAVGLESLSRGARTATFVEASPKAAAIIRANIAKLRYEERANLVIGPLPGQLGRLAPPPGGFDRVFIMPPYDSELGPAVLAELHARPLVSGDALAIVEIRRDEHWPASVPHGWSQADDRTYGVTRLLFLERKSG